MQIIGIGETIIDIIFKNNCPISANPGGSTFNTFISLGRMGLDATFVSEVGNDHFGQMACDFLRSNRLTDKYMHRYSDGKTPIAIAFLDKENKAEYAFYKESPKQLQELTYPLIAENDIFIFGSYFALNPSFRNRVKTLTEKAKNANAIVYYDPNFRPSHLAELPELQKSLEENFASADVVRGSDEDFFYLFREKDLEKIYKKVSYFCKNMICTRGANGVEVFTPNFHKHYDTPKIEAKSTIGAGDNFNAGFIYGLKKYQITKKALPLLTENEWDKLIRCATAFSTEVCCSVENYVSVDFAKNFK